jgi:peptide/nickel transport system substrate-binding protein
MKSFGLLGRAGALAVAALMVPGLALAQGNNKLLKMVPHADLKVTDPNFTTATITADHAMMVYDMLFAWDSKLTPKPQMVGNYTVSPDKLKYTFTLRPGLNFHDDTPVTTKDVIPSLRRWMARESTGQKLSEFTASIDAVDASTFTITLKEPYGLVLFTLASSAGTIPGVMPEAAAKIDAFTAHTNTIGSGPFKYVAAELVSGSKVVYAKHTGYVPRSEPADGLAGGRVAKVDRVEWVSMPDQAVSSAALTAGEVDMIEAIDNDQRASLQRNPNVTVEALSKLGWFGMLRPNHLHPPFNHPKARQALALMINQQEYMQAAFGGGQNCFSFFTCGSPNGTEAGSEAYQKPDYEKAKQLLKEAGYNGEKIVLLGAGDIFRHNAIAQVTAENLKKIGLNVDLQMSDWGAVVTRRGKKDNPYQGGYHIFQTFSDGIGSMSPLTNIALGTACDGKNWFGWPCDAEAEKLRDQFVRATTEIEQTKILEALNKRYWEMLPYIPLGKYERLSAWRKNLDGVLRTNVLALWNIEKK